MKKLTLQKLKVNSFITDQEALKILGGEAKITMQTKPTADCFTGMYPSINMPCALCDK